jgi:hypothetical protein
MKNAAGSSICPAGNRSGIGGADTYGWEFEKNFELPQGKPKGGSPPAEEAPLFS